MIEDDTATAAARFSALARELAEQPDPTATAGRVVELAASVLGCTGAGILTLGARDQLSIVAASDLQLLGAAARIADETGDSVSRQVLLDRATVLSNDLAADPRWPKYSARLVAETPVRSAMGFFLILDQLELGAMTLYSDRVGFFTPKLADRAGIFADHAAIALARSAEHAEAGNLRVALSSSREIGIAIGIVMATHRVSEQHAFDMLRTASQHTHRKLRDVAAEVALTGEVPQWSKV